MRLCTVTAAVTSGAVYDHTTYVAKARWTFGWNKNQVWKPELFLYIHMSRWHGRQFLVCVCVLGGRGGGRDFPLSATHPLSPNKSKSSSLSCTYQAVAPVLLSYCGCWIWQGPLGLDWRKKCMNRNNYYSNYSGVKKSNQATTKLMITLIYRCTLDKIALIYLISPTKGCDIAFVVMVTRMTLSV